MSIEMGERLKALRTEHGLSMKELGEAVGVTASTIHRHESGDFVKRSTLKAYADWFGVKEKWLEFGTGCKTEAADQEQQIAIQAQKIAESTKIVSSQDKERFQTFDELIKLLPYMNISKDKQRKYYKVLVTYRNELELKVLFGDEEAALRQATAIYGR